MSDLIAIDKSVSAASLFTEDGIDPLLRKIKEEVLKLEPDMTTESGRKDIASLAYRVAKSKTYLDGLGKELTANWKKKAKIVDDARRKIRDELDDLKDKVREPLTKFENEEKERVERAQTFVSKIESYRIELTSENSSAEIEAAAREFADITMPGDLKEFHEKAAKEINETDRYLESISLKAKKKEDDQRELERLRQEEEKRKQKEREEELKKEAADRARKEAEEKSLAEREQAGAAKREAEEREQKAKDELEAAKVREKELEERRKREAEEFKRREKEAAEGAAKERAIAEQKAKENERKRAEQERQKQADEARRREEDMEHRKKINNEILDHLISCAGLNKDSGKDTIRAIGLGKIPHVKINY